VRYTIHSRVLPAPAPRFILEKEPGVHATQYLDSRLTQRTCRQPAAAGAASVDADGNEACHPLDQYDRM
jgi:hypothetical protein